MKIENSPLKIVFLIHFFENFGVLTVFSAKILSRRFRLSRTSKARSRLIRPRPIDCDRGPEQTVKIFPVLGFVHRQKSFLSGARSIVLIYTPKEAHRIFVTGESIFARQMLANKKTGSWGGQRRIPRL